MKLGLLLLPLFLFGCGGRASSPENFHGAMCVMKDSTGEYYIVDVFGKAVIHPDGVTGTLDEEHTRIYSRGHNPCVVVY